MKRKITKVKPDGSKEIIEIDDEAPAHHKTEADMALQGHKGDTELAHVNKWEEELLKRLGGAGTTNPHTGLKQFYTANAAPTGGETWLDMMNRTEGATSGLPYWQQGHADPSGNWIGASTVNGTSGNSTPLYNWDPTKNWSKEATTTQGGPVPRTLANWQAMSGVTNQNKPSTHSNVPENPVMGGAAIPGTSGSPLSVVNSDVNVNRGGLPDIGTVPDGSDTSVPGAGWVNDPNAQSDVMSQVTNPLTSPQIATDYANYFAQAQPNMSMPWAGGTLTMGQGGQAIYRDAAGTETPLNANTPLVDLYKIPGIKTAWDQQYGGAATSGTGGIDIPTNIFPFSTSGSTSGANTYSGLPANYQQQLLSALMPQLNSAVTNMPGNIDQYTQNALGSYQQLMNNNLKTNIPKAISEMANRGIINSTEGQKILENVYSAAAKEAGDKGYTTAMQAALLKANMPSVLGQIGELGKTSTSTSTGQSSSYQADPTVMYRTLADMITAMM
jgi:hypothetical protein